MATALGFRENELSMCIKELYFLHSGSAKSSLQAARKKYSCAKFVAAHPYIA
jgi:hypothetical protein